MLKRISTNMAEAIPYRNSSEMIKIIKLERKKDRYVEVWNGFIYSARKWREKR